MNDDTTMWAVRDDDSGELAAVFLKRETADAKCRDVFGTGYSVVAVRVTVIPEPT